MKKSIPMNETLDEHERRVLRRARWAQGALIVLGLGMMLLYVLAGCAMSGMPRESIRQTVLLSEPPDMAYQRATKAMVRMGGEISHANAQDRLLSARVHGVVILNVTVSPTPTGASVEVVGSLLPGHVVIGSFDEVQTYMALLQ